MNKITKPIIVSALSALAFGAVGVAGTFALFTDNTETAISAQAGIVDVGLNASNLATYSAEANAQGDRIDERGAKYISKPTAVGTFTNGGTASLEGGALTMRKLTPGDRVTFEAGLVNHSNVAIKYRLVYKFTGTNGVLAQGLVTKTNISGSAKTYEGLREFVAPWTFLEAGAALPSTAITFDIELPINRGNDYQGKEASFSLYVEAVQGNAYVEDEARTLLFGRLTPAQEAEQEVEHPDEPTILQTTSELATTTVKTTIPANTSYRTESQTTDEPAPIATDDTVKLVVSDLVVAEDTATKKGTVDLDISLLVNDVAVSQFSKLVNVEVNIGKRLDITSVTHNGNPVTDYTYDSSEGILRFTTMNFSPFTVEYSIIPNTSYGFFDSYQKNGHWVHEIKTPAHFRNIGVASYKYPEVSGGDNVYLLVDDIDFGGVSPWFDGSSWINIGYESEKTIHDFEFNGILDGANHTLSNINLTQEMGPSPAVGDHDYGGLFDSVGVATFKNFTVSHVTINATDAKPGAIIAAGTKKATSKITFDHVTVDDSCRIDGQQGCAAFLGYARNASEMHFSYCTNQADIVVTGSNVGAFMGSLTGGSASRSIRFDHCVNSGDISGYDLIGSFYGSNSDNGTVVFDSCQNTGNITTFSGTNAGLFVGKYHTLAKFTFTNTTNTGTLYAANAVEVKSTNTEFTSTTFTTAEAAQAFVQGFAALSPTIGFDAANNLVIGGLDGHEDDYDYAIVTISLGPIDTFRLSDSYMIASGGDTVATQQVTDVANVNLKKLTKAGWFAPTATTPTGAFQGDGPSGASLAWFDYYKIPFELKGTQGYENGYHTTADGSYYIISNENCVDSFTQIMNGHTSISYKVVLYKNINNKYSIVGFKEKTDSCYGVVGANPNPILLPYYTGE